ncbi:MAG: alpha,4-glucan--maltose-phosphate maltosyltransferase [Acidimicrobiales bacterium]|nr:alpha,4-glucan--maltose-phosphate maltosyltransferase [Acidimicrobiales bacterium]
MARRAPSPHLDPSHTATPVVAQPLPRKPPTRVRVEHLGPAVDGGAVPVAASLGETLTLSADILRDGHDALRAVLRWKGPGDHSWSEAPMTHVDAASAGVRWAAPLTVDRLGSWRWTVHAWAEPLASWREEVRRKAEAGQDDLESELAEGAALLEAAAKRAKSAKGDKAARDADRKILTDAAAHLADRAAPAADRVATALASDVVATADRHPDRSRPGAPADEGRLRVDPVLARFGSWYELFPRSWGGLQGVRQRLPALAELGFDVLYLPPIHPIGRTNRKGRNNTLTAGPDDPGSPWAIGDASGGHTAVHPDLGTVDDLEALVVDARALGIEVALDFAIQCSADHPWLTEHPEWFFHRPDGTLKYAENPPKKYQDIYNVDFDCEDWQGLWQALLEVVAFWIDHGVRVFRVDNTHTKQLAFWQWLIDSVHETHPEVVLLAEAFTYRAMMQELAKVGFGQSYTYFTWKSSKAELTEYVSELASTDERLYFRPNFFVNTPDILTEELQTGGPATFAKRLILAATLAPSYGVYSGFEHFEHVAVRAGSEEYLDSEKYEAKERALDGPLLPLIADLNRIRRANPALQQLADTTFLETENDALIAYAKRAGANIVLVVVNLDPHQVQEGVAVVPAALGLPPSFEVVDELTGEQFGWQVGRNYVRLSPGQRPAHVLRVVGA